MKLRTGTILLVFVTGLVAGLRSLANGVPAIGPFGADPAAAAPAPQPDPYFTLLTTDPGPDEAAGILAMRRGLQGLEAGQHAQARTAFMEAAGQLPALEDWALLHAAAAAAAAGQSDTVEMILMRVDPWLALERGWRIRVDALRRSGGTDRALPVALDAAARAATAEQRAQAAFEAAQIQFTLRDSAGARLSLRRAIDEAPGSTVALDAARLLTTVRGVTPDDHLAIGRLYARHGNATRALTSLDRWLASGQGIADERAAVQLELGRALFTARRYVEVERRMTAALAGTLPDSLAAEARLLVGRSRYRQNRITQGRATLRAVADSFPAAPAAAEALFLVADLEHDAGRLDAARTLYLRAVETGSARDAAGDAALRLGGLLLADGDAAGAAAVFTRYHRAGPEGDRLQQAAFWAGRATMDAGDSAAGRAFLREALEYDPVTWYGQRAAELLGDGSWTDSLAPDAQTGPAGERLARGALHRMDLLAELGLGDAFDIELEHARARLFDEDNAIYALAEGLHLREGRLLTAVLLGREIKRREGRWSPRLLRIVYPFPFRDEILAHATSRGLDPYLVAGLIRQESLFNPTIRSSAGAIGLMQVRPATGRELARRAGVSPFSNNLLTRPDTNVRLGTLYFSELLARYDGRIGYVLAAYNAGPSRLARWRELPEARDADLFAERIPFRETREYVKIVQQNAGIYRALYAE